MATDMLLNDIASHVYFHVPNAIDIEVVDGYCPQDTILATVRKNPDIKVEMNLLPGQDGADSHVLCGNFLVRDGAGSEFDRCHDNMCWDMSADEDHLGEVCQYVTSRLLS